ncbi:GNAT family N-acetyltransferase [Dyella tabacisoli]|nr:GNAT family N-acetyltransferase [Dyella tabacisoli]
MSRSSKPVVVQRHRVVPAQPWDILFLVSEVSSGVARGHFSPEGCGTRQAQIALALRCAKAILGRQWMLRRLFEPVQFVVVRSAKSTLGGALVVFSRNDDGQQVVTIECLVVESRFRRDGVGEALVRYFLTNAPEGAIVQCFCTPHSQGMQKLLKHLGFIRNHKVFVVNKGEGRILMPSHWIWCSGLSSLPLP